MATGKRIPQALRSTLSIVTLTSIACSAMALIVHFTISWRPVNSNTQLSSSESSSEIPANDPAHPSRTRAPSQVDEKHHRGMQKPGGQIVASISKSGNDGDVTSVVTLTGNALVKFPVAELHFAYSLPEGVQLISGALEGSVANVGAGESRNFEIAVRRTSPGAKRIQFRAYRLKDGEAIGSSAIVILGEVALDEASNAQMKMQGNDSLEKPTTTQPRAPRSPEEFRRRAIL